MPHSCFSLCRSGFEDGNHKDLHQKKHPICIGILVSNVCLLLSRDQFSKMDSLDTPRNWNCISAHSLGGLQKIGKIMQSISRQTFLILCVIAIALLGPRFLIMAVYNLNLELFFIFFLIGLLFIPRRKA